MKYSVFCIPLFYLACIKPNKARTEKIKPFIQHRYYAHRGLHDKKEKPENSIPAFQSSAAHGYGIELDVQKTKDHVLVVFHDTDLKRLCNVEKKLYQCTYQELQKYYLKDTKEQIPRFEDVLKTIDGKVPLIVEIKSDGDWKKTTKLTVEMLRKYKGAYCIESFHPLILFLVRFLNPKVIRGQLSTNFARDKDMQHPIIKLFLTNLLFNFCSKPDFIAYKHLYVNQISYLICKKLFSVTNVAWTIRSKQELQKAKKHFDMIIFEGFLPPK